jgi:AraC-like DNA-binding protein
MILETFLPTERLRPFIKCYTIVDCSTTVVNSLLPGTSLIMGVRYKGETRYVTETEKLLPFAVVAGLRKSVQQMKDDSGTGNLLVFFKPGRAPAFFKEPIYDTYGEVLALNEFSNFRNLNELEDKLGSAKSNQERIQVVEQFLISRLCSHKPDPLIANAVQHIKMYKGSIKIRELASHLCISLDAFEKRFRRELGASPKQFCHIVRMNAIIDGMHHKILVQNAFEAGYYDQAHFTKDFKVFTGKTPAEFLKTEEK